MSGLLPQAFEISAYCLPDAEIEGVGNEGMSDADFIEERERILEESEIVEVEVVSGIEPEPEAQGFFRSCHKGSHGGITAGAVVVGIGFV